jgi:poly-gamma-glutamate synthesis protein (capsule biosynthesis protein)
MTLRLLVLVSGALALSPSPEHPQRPTPRGAAPVRHGAVAGPPARGADPSAHRRAHHRTVPPRAGGIAARRAAVAQRARHRAGSRLTLVFTGDVALNWRGTSPTLERFPWSQNPLRFLAPLFHEADLAVANMEGVLMRTDPQYAEKRLNLWAPWASAQIFHPAGIDLVSTANNHAFDGRDAGVFETLAHLRKTGVAVMGTGRTAAEARRPYVLRRAGTCLAVLPATTKVNLRGQGEAHVAFYPADREDRLLARVRRARRRCPFVVVYIHWGVEKAHYPRPRIRRLAHALVDAGANLVVGHHPHVLEGVQWRGEALIAYSLGNLVFSNPTLPTRRTGVLRLQVRLPPPPRAAPRGEARGPASADAPPAGATAGFAAARIERAELVPVFIHLRRYTPRLANRRRSLDLLRRVQSYSRPFGTQVVLRQGRLRFLHRRARRPPAQPQAPDRDQVCDRDPSRP